MHLRSSSIRPAKQPERLPSLLPRQARCKRLHSRPAQQLCQLLCQLLSQSRRHTRPSEPPRPQQHPSYTSLILWPQQKRQRLMLNQLRSLRRQPPSRHQLVRGNAKLFLRQLMPRLLQLCKPSQVPRLASVPRIPRLQRGCLQQQQRLSHTSRRLPRASLERLPRVQWVPQSSLQCQGGSDRWTLSSVLVTSASVLLIAMRSTVPIPIECVSLSVHTALSDHSQYSGRDLATTHLDLVTSSMSRQVTRPSYV